MAGLTKEAAKAAIKAEGLDLRTKQGKARLAELTAPVLETACTPTPAAPMIDWGKASKSGGLEGELNRLIGLGISPAECANWDVVEFKAAYFWQSTTSEQKIKKAFPVLAQLAGI